jgi:hypothetical protein
MKNASDDDFEKMKNNMKVIKINFLRLGDLIQKMDLKICQLKD